MTYHHSWVELSRSNLISNIQTTRKLLSDATKLFAVVKANAYGHGLAEIMRAATPHVDGFCLAGTEEAIIARKLTNKRLIALSYLSTNSKKHLQELVNHKIEIPIYDEESLRTAIASKKKLFAHIKIDTGTTRIGFQRKDIPSIIKTLKQAPQINIVGVYSHFAQAEKNKQSFTSKQLKFFSDVSKTLIHELNAQSALRHIACSAAVTKYPNSHFDAVRLGIHLYGLSGIAHYYDSLKPVLEWKTRVIQIKKVPEGTTIGYNRTYKVKKSERIAVLPIGYADGYPRSLSNKGYVLIRGKKAPIRGNICMNLCMVDVSSISNAHVGDEAVLIGKSHSEHISADVLAKQSDSINYEVISRINPTLARIMI